MIEVKNICKSFKQQLVLDDLDLQWNAGEILILTGASGSGKTTLLRILAGFEVPDQGTVHIGNKLATDQKIRLSPRKRKLGLVFQQPVLWPHMRVKQHVLFGVERKRDTHFETLKSIADDCEISHLLDKYPAELSVGEKRRVALARALATSPEFLMLDEAFVNLDTPLRDKLLQMLLNRQKSLGFGLLLVTHLVDDLREISGRVLTIESGKIHQISGR